MWDNGRFWSEFQMRVKEMDEMGFRHVPITVGLSVHSIKDFPFVDRPGQGLIKTFLQNATATYGKRYVFTFNLDPYYDHTLSLDDGSDDECAAALDRALCWERGCLVPDTMTLLRQRIHALTGDPNHRFWIGKVGWASENSSNLRTEMQYCTNFSSNKSLETFYRGFLQWDMKLGGERPPDYVFYHTLRNAPTADVMDHFGLITTCETETCKIFASNITDATEYFGADLWWLPMVFILLGVLICGVTICTTIVVRARRSMGCDIADHDFDDSNSDFTASSDE